MLRTPIIFITNLLRISQALVNKYLLRGRNFKSIYRDMSIPVILLSSLQTLFVAIKQRI